MTRPSRPALFALPTRRAALGAIAAAPVATIAGTAISKTAISEIDPVLIARDAWREAKRAYLDALHRAETAGGDQCVEIPAALGGDPRRAITAADIDKIIGQERNNAAFAFTRWGANPPKSAATEEQKAAARVWCENRPDAEALKDTLAEANARLAAAWEAENVDALDRAERDAHKAFIATPATSAEGIAAKLRADSDPSYEVDAALADLDRMAGQGVQIATGSTESAVDADYNSSDARLDALILTAQESGAPMHVLEAYTRDLDPAATAKVLANADTLADTHSVSMARVDAGTA